MINNKDIIDCFNIAYSNTINHNSIIKDYDEVKSDNDIGFKLLCNKKRSCYVLLVHFSESLIATDFKRKIIQFLDNTEEYMDFENGKCDRSLYDKACQILNKIAPNIGNFTINKFFCVGFYDGGSISSAIVTIIRHNYYKKIEYHEMFERFKNNIYGIVFAAFQTFSPEINESTRNSILNFALENEKYINFNLKQTFPGTFLNLGLWTKEKDSVFMSFLKKTISYLHTSKTFLIQYQNAISEFVDDNETITDIKALLMKCNSMSKRKQNSMKKIKKDLKHKKQSQRKKTITNKKSSSLSHSKIKDTKNQSQNSCNLSGDNTELITIEKEIKRNSMQIQIITGNQEENNKSKSEQSNTQSKSDNNETNKLTSTSVQKKLQLQHEDINHESKKLDKINKKQEIKQNFNLEKELPENNSKPNESNKNKENSEKNIKLNLKQNENNDNKENTSPHIIEKHMSLNPKLNKEYLQIKRYKENNEKMESKTQAMKNLDSQENEQMLLSDNVLSLSSGQQKRDFLNQAFKSHITFQNNILNNSKFESSHNNHEKCKFSSKIQNEKLLINKNKDNISKPPNKDKSQTEDNIQNQMNDKYSRLSTSKKIQNKDLQTYERALHSKLSSNIQNEKGKQVSSQMNNDQNESKENERLFTSNKYQDKKIRQKSKSLQPKSFSKIQNEKQTETEKQVSSQLNKEHYKSKQNMQNNNQKENIKISTLKTFQYKDIQRHVKTLQSRSSYISHSLSIPRKKINFSNSNSFVNNNVWEQQNWFNDSTLTKNKWTKKMVQCKTTQFKSYRYLNYETPKKKIRPLIIHSKLWLDDAYKYY